jgi:hypothetical protein
MSLLCLNCQGCGRPEAVHEIHKVVDLNRPKVLFLSETRMSATRAQKMCHKLGFSNVFGVSSQGFSGGLVLMWKDDMSLVIKTYSKYHVDVCITEADGKLWHFTGFYGEPRRVQRKESWQLLHFLRNENDLPWLCGGDFNETLHSHEQIGGNERQEWSMEGFREIVDYCGFRDLGYSGLPYIWDNRRQGTVNIKVHLDHALASLDWSDMFGDSVVQHIQMSESDHSGHLIWMNVSEMVNHRGYRNRPFRYENMCRWHHTYNDTVIKAWNTSSSNLGDVQANLGSIKRKLSTLEHDEFGSVRKELHHLRQKLEEE